MAEEKKVKVQWSIELNKYQRDNLLLLLNALGYPWTKNPFGAGLEPFIVFNNGDWVGEIAQKLADDDGVCIVREPQDRPNISADEIREEVERWKRRSLKEEK